MAKEAKKPKTPPTKPTKRESWKGDRTLAALKTMVTEKKSVPAAGVSLTKLGSLVEKKGARLTLAAAAKKMSPTEVYKSYRARARRA